MGRNVNNVTFLHAVIGSTHDSASIERRRRPVCTAANSVKTQFAQKHKFKYKKIQILCLFRADTQFIQGHNTETQLRAYARDEITKIYFHISYFVYLLFHALKFWRGFPCDN